MNGLEFVASLIDSLVWPAVVVTAFVVFQTPLASLLRRLRRAEVRGNNFDFDNEVTAAQQNSTDQLEVVKTHIEIEPTTTAELPVSNKHPGSFPMPPTDPIDVLQHIRQWRNWALSSASPVTGPAVPMCWNFLTRAMKYQGEYFKVLPERPAAYAQPPHLIMRALQDAEANPPLLTRDTADLINTLRMLRNFHAHSEEADANTDAGSAISYLESVTNVATILVTRCLQPLVSN